MAEENENKIRTARREDWKTEPMPEQQDTFVLKRHFTQDEMDALRRGNVPKAMEDKWFWYMEGSTMETDRLILRRWRESDAEDLYEYARDPDVGPIAGWLPHKSADESREVIKNVLNGREAYAICLKESGKAIGAIELRLKGRTDMTDRDDECEMGYWLGKPFWGRGIMPEAVDEMLRHAFEDLGMEKVWIGYYDGNTRSKRVQEKCGFKYQWRSENVDVPNLGEKRNGHVSMMTREDWLAILQKGGVEK